MISDIYIFLHAPIVVVVNHNTFTYVSKQGHSDKEEGPWKNLFPQS